MKRLLAILTLLTAFSIGLFAQTPNITGDWDGPNDLILHFTYNPTTKKVKVDYCGIYRVMEWHPTATIENGYLVLTQSKDSDGNSFNGRLRIESKDKMSGSLTMSSYGETSFSGNATFIRSKIPYYSDMMGMPGNNPDIDTSL